MQLAVNRPCAQVWLYVRNLSPSTDARASSTGRDACPTNSAASTQCEGTKELAMMSNTKAGPPLSRCETGTKKPPDGRDVLERLLRIFALIALKAIVERFEADAQHFRGTGFVAAGEVDRPNDQFAF